MRFLTFLVLFAIQVPALAQANIFGEHATIYLVRHAEKGSGNDPLLTDDGNKRAGDLARLLKNKSIGRIYVTEYKRTQNTGDSLRIQLGIDTVHYLSDTSCLDVLDKIKVHKDTDKPILIIGHSNTIPLIIGKLGIAGYAKDDIPANEFDNLFQVIFKRGTVTLVKSKYGSASGASAAMQ